MQRRDDGWWFIQIMLPHGHHQYRFLVDDKPVLDPREWEKAGITRTRKFRWPRLDKAGTDCHARIVKCQPRTVCLKTLF